MTSATSSARLTQPRVVNTQWAQSQPERTGDRWLDQRLQLWRWKRLRSCFPVGPILYIFIYAFLHSSVIHSPLVIFNSPYLRFNKENKETAGLNTGQTQRGSKLVCSQALKKSRCFWSLFTSPQGCFCGIKCSVLRVRSGCMSRCRRERFTGWIETLLDFPND